MARTPSFIALRGFFTFFCLVSTFFQQPHILAFAHAHVPSQRDAEDTLSVRARHRLIKRFPSAQPHDYVTNEVFAERSEERTNFGRATNSTVAATWNGQS